MDFEKLVEYYEKISATKKRLEILDIMIQLFTEIKNNPSDAADLEKIIYLTQGTLYPEIKEQPKIGLADRSLLDFISKYYTVDAKTAQEILKRTGDLGDTCEEFAKLKKGKQGQITSFMGMAEDKLTISDIYGKLEEISAISGSGSLDKKEMKLKWLLARCKPAMVKYLMRIITSSMRVGVSDPTIMDALAVTFLGNKELRESVEYAYNVHPDLGFIARQLYQKGLDGITQLNIQVGIPIRMMLASRLQYTQILAKLGGKEFLSEFKLDGERLQIHKDKENITIFSRKLRNITDMYPDVKDAVLKSIKAEKVILEGEAVAMDSLFEQMLPFQIVITRKRKYDVYEMVKKVPVRLFVFDMLYLERGSKKEIVMNYPLLKRRELIKEVLTESQHIKLVEGKIIHTTEELVDYFKYARSLNTEGLMNKSIDPENSSYKAGNRGFLWIKLKSLEAGKMTDTIDVTPIGALWGKGRRANMYGAFLVAVYNEETDKYELLTRVASGFSDDDMVKFMELLKPYKSPIQPNNVTCSEKADVWFNPALVIEIAGDELTVSPKADAGKFFNGNVNESGYSVRFPTFQKIRNDKDVTEITTVEEIVELYEIQGGSEQKIKEESKKESENF